MNKKPIAILLLFLILTALCLLPGVATATSPHIVTIDGANDFAADEDVSGTSGSAWYFTWDADNFYFGTSNDNVDDNSSTKWVLLYIDSDPTEGNGTSTGVLYNTQQPGLPFRADYHFRWKTDNTYTSLLAWNGSSWVDGDQTNVARGRNGTFVEFRIPRANIGSPQAIRVVAGMINEANGGEWTYYMAPNTNSEGYDANYTHYFGFPLTDGVSPDDSAYVDHTHVDDAQALWVDTRTVAWNGVPGAGYKLLYDPDGGLKPIEAGAAACPTSPTGPCYVDLTANGTIGSYEFPKNPNANGKPRLDLPSAAGLSDETIKTLLRGEVAVASYEAGGVLVDVSRAQVQGVLDALYATAAAGETLGPAYVGNVPSVKLWAPTAKSVVLRRYADSTTTSYTQHAMTRDPASGVWTVTGQDSWNRQFYLFSVEVYVPAVDAVVHNLVTDPYAVSLSQDAAAADDVRSQFVNLADTDLEPAGWDSLVKPALDAPEDMTIYEVHVRDFSINDMSVTNEDHRGTFKAFTYDGAGAQPLSDGMAHLLQMQQAGLTHVHLLPAFDIASVIEEAADRTEPPILPADRNSEQQQATVATYRHVDGFNWGYDPYHYGLPEGSYATNSDGVTRILEFREMVQALNQNGLRVVMDVVYNHTAASGQDDKSVLDKIVPGYYYRYDADGNLYNSSCCSDTAAEYAMMQKLLEDTVLRWATEYRVDGFRFDLMNLHTRQNMLDVQSAVQLVDPTIYVYGEGWDFGSAKDKGLTTCPDCYAKQYNMTGTGIGTFNDRLRDATHGGYNTDPLQIRHQGFLNGLSYDWNGYCYSNREQSDLRGAMADLRTALAGSGGFYADDPQETINYVEKHDNETLFDQNVFKLPNGTGDPGACGSSYVPPVTSVADRVRVQNLGTSLVGLAQGVPFFQMGQDLLRSKSLDRNSYDSGDWFNQVDWTLGDNNFGKGLPPSWDNESRWGIMAPLLADVTLDPGPEDMAAAAAHMREILRIRGSSPLFRLRTEAEANGRISFYNAGDSPQDALIVMKLSDAPDPDLDPAYETLLVFINAHKIAQSFSIPEAAGLGFELHPILADMVDEDPVVKTATFDGVSGQFTIPARTTAVFVSSQVLASPSTLDWVGLMWPRGGVSHEIATGNAAGGFDVYVQVYKPGVTDGSGQGAGIDCFLHWGHYGGAWQDQTMAYNVDQGNNDEYRATIPQATLNSLAAGTYGFTAYCSENGGASKMWKQDSYNLDGNPDTNTPGDKDVGDGILSITPTDDASPAPGGGVSVHLFEWKWTDIAKECTYLAAKGYDAVQISPPSDHIDDPAWWARYQPASYELTSRSGTPAEFDGMVAACNSAGVAIYADAVINHMTAGSGTSYGGAAYTKYDYPAVPYDPANFHPACDLGDYSDRSQVQTCQLLGLADLDHGSADTLAKVQAYLNDLIARGVKGFRIDGSKHILSYDVEQVLAGVNSLPDGSRPYVFQEVIEAVNEPVKEYEYYYAGDVTEFGVTNSLGWAFSGNTGCNGTLADLSNFGTGMMPGQFAQVFLNNHDNQRGHGTGSECIVTYKDGDVHDLATVFMLAHPYGYPSVMSSYYFGDGDQGPPGDSVYVGDTPTRCGDGTNWVCEHRRTAIANMVRFRGITDGQPLTGWTTHNSDHISFGRNGQGFVAINRGDLPATTTYNSGMPAGTYCDIVRYDFLPDSAECVLPGTTTEAPLDDLIVVNASGEIESKQVVSMAAFAIHVGARTDVDYGSLGESYGLVWHTASTLQLGEVWRQDDGVSFSGFPASGQGTVHVDVRGAAGTPHLQIWFDWDGSGVFDQVEKVYDGSPPTGGNLSVSVPAGLSGPVNYRARLFDAAPAGLLVQDDDALGGATGGEVEDGQSPSPTAVELASFTASPQPGAVLLEWETASELGTLGFHLYRSTSSCGQLQRLNEALIPAQQPGSPAGARYAWTDRDAPPGVGYYYWLDSVDVWDNSTRYGPASVAAGFFRLYVPVCLREN